MTYVTSLHLLELLDKTEDKIGLISLEESIGDTAEKFIHMSLNKNTNTFRILSNPKSIQIKKKNTNPAK